VLRAAQAQIEDAAHTLAGYLNHREPDPERLADLDPPGRVGLAGAPLPAQHRQNCRRCWPAGRPTAGNWMPPPTWRRWNARWPARSRPGAAKRKRLAPAPPGRTRLAAAVTQAMQQLGMAGGRFEVALLPQAEPQAYGLEAVELRVAGHAGSTPRALAKVASGGELSRLALAIAVTTAQGAPLMASGVPLT
jgi:DNA repair protein RecN (Recombination protein N)